MAARAKDPTEPIRLKASRYPEVDKGTACTQTSFKTNKKAFLFIGPQGGRYKAMFKLRQSAAQMAKLAEKDPDRFGIGSGGWATARFSAEDPLPRKLWEKWLDESYELTRGASPVAKSTTKKRTKVSTESTSTGIAKKKVTKKRIASKKA